MAKADSTSIVRDHSFQDLNPLIEWNDDGTVAIDDTINHLARFSIFCEDLYSKDEVPQTDNFAIGMHYCQRMVTAALERISTQLEQDADARRDPETKERIRRMTAARGVV